MTQNHRGNHKWKLGLMSGGMETDKSDKHYTNCFHTQSELLGSKTQEKRMRNEVLEQEGPKPGGL